MMPVVEVYINTRTGFGHAGINVRGKNTGASVGYVEFKVTSSFDWLLAFAL